MKRQPLKYLNFLGVLLSILSLGSFLLLENAKYQPWPNNNPSKVAAFEVLKTHCNTCHIDKNPRRVFTLENMDKSAKKIKRQVFVFKRMPKGKARRDKITETEMKALKNWINHTLKK